MRISDWSSDVCSSDLAADAVHFSAIGLSHAQRLGTPERLEREESHDVGLRVLLGKRQAIVSSTDLATDRLDELVARALAMARVVPADPYCGLAAPEHPAAAVPALDLPAHPQRSPAAPTQRARASQLAAPDVPGGPNPEGAEA